jgi:DNA helicase-2/ATP-dependent DNA helicase PcrA
VIAAAAAVLASTTGRSGVTGGSLPGAADGGRPDGPTPTVLGFDDDAEEAIAVVRWLRLMHRPGRPWSHLAVLARTNARLGPVTAALRQAGIPFRLGPAPRTGAALADAIKALRAMPAGRPLRSALADLSIPDDRVPGAGRGPGPGIPAALSRLADEQAVEEPGSNIGGFLAWLAATAGDGALAEADPDGDAVELSTFHRAKGLEWPAVALIGLEDGLVPISYATTAAARAEERRLLYVAVTRAEEQLWCSWARQREAGGRAWTCRPSPFLDAIEAVSRTAKRTLTGPTFATQMASLRQRLPVAG